jgi:hypothetical protein
MCVDQWPLPCTSTEPPILTQGLHPDVKCRLQIEPGQKGIDVTVPDCSVEDVGYTHGVIKPNTESGERKLARQLLDWGLKRKDVQVFTYDGGGNIYDRFNY